MECDRGDSFPFDFEPNGIPFGSKSKASKSKSYPIQCGRILVEFKGISLQVNIKAKGKFQIKLFSA